MTIGGAGRQAPQEGAEGLALPTVVPGRCGGGSYLRAAPAVPPAPAAAATAS